MPRARWPSCLKRVSTSRAHCSHRHQRTGTEALPAACAPPTASRRQQTSPFKHLLAKLFCCHLSAADPHHPPNNSSGDGENMEMGPLTLEDYIKTLEPYDPAVHGWRGDEPWKLRTTIITITCKCPINCAPIDINGNGTDAASGRMAIHNNQCFTNYSTDNILYI